MEKKRDRESERARARDAEKEKVTGFKRALKCIPLLFLVFVRSVANQLKFEILSVLLQVVVNIYHRVPYKLCNVIDLVKQNNRFVLFACVLVGD